MNPQLKAQDCFDHDPIEAWQPADPVHVDYQLCLHIGPADKQGADLFYVNILSEVSASELDAAELARRKKIVVKDYSWNAVKHAIDDILHQINEPTWNQAALKLSQCFDWEFENYKAYEPRA